MLLKPPKPPPTKPPGKRPGSTKRDKTKDLRIDQDPVLQPSDLSPGAVLEGYRDFVVQDLVFKSNNTRYRRSVYRLPDGTLRVAERPDDVNCHFGLGLRQYILLQVHQNHFTQNRLLEQLRDTGISAGQISNILLAGHDAFHNERKIDRLIPLTVAHRRASSYHTSFLSRGPLPACLAGAKFCELEHAANTTPFPDSHQRAAFGGELVGIWQHCGDRGLISKLIHP